MALRTSRPQSLLQDENAQANMISGKAPLRERKGLQQQQQQAPLERKKLSNITNHVLLQPKQAGGKATAEKESFAVRADSQETVPVPTAKKPSRPPLKNISNGMPHPVNHSTSKPPIKSKSELNPQTQSSTFQLPPRSKLNLTEEMKKKAALWAEEGIEKVHFTGEDMEKQRLLIRDREIAKRVEMIRNCRMDIPFPKFSAPCSLDSSTWKPPGNVLELDVVKDLSDDENVARENDGRNMKMVDEMLGCIDYFAIRSPPRLTEGWPKVKGYEEIEE